MSLLLIFRSGTATVPVSGPVTIAGGGTSARRFSRATPYYYKTLSELREEEKAKLERLRKAARRRVAKAINAGETDEGLLVRMAKLPFETATSLDWLTVPLIDELALMIVAALLQAALNDEDDAEALLLLAA